MAGVMIVIFVMGGAFIHTFGVLLPVITADFGWSRATVALSLSLGIVAFGLPSPIVGILVDRLGPRLCIIIGNTLGGLALMGMYFAQEIWHIYLLYIILGLGSGLGGYIPSSTVVNNWFIRRRSLAMGLFMGCGGLGAFTFPPLAATLIDSIGWRMTYLAIGGGCMFIAVVIGGIGLVRNPPLPINGKWSFNKRLCRERAAAAWAN